MKALTTTFAPLRQAAYRRIWVASLFCNAGQQIQSVAAAWMMVQLTAAPSQVALVQTASMLPVMLLALPGGAIADIYDRRKAAIAALLLALIGTLALALLALTGTIKPALILAGCVVVGAGTAFFTPAWQSSVVELVGVKALPAGVALNAMSNNLARSIGPAIGGLVILLVGGAAAFAINALLYVPMLVALLCWRRRDEVNSKLPPENLLRASVSGVRYATLSSSVRRVLLRSTVSAFGTSAVFALLPFVARINLTGGAGTYGMLLGAFGCGAVASSVLAGVLRGRLEPERSVRVYSIAQGVAMVVLALSHVTLLTMIALAVIGACWVTNNAMFNIGIQMKAPRWVAGRLLAILFATAAGGLSFGSWTWGHLASTRSVVTALLIAAGLLLLSPLLAFVLRMPPRTQTMTQSVPSATSPDVRIHINGRSGPIALEIIYRMNADRVAQFYQLTQRLSRVRKRNGAYGVSLARDIADSQLWVERFHFPTWHDYVRSRDRPTQAERELQEQVNALHVGPEPIVVRRWLERPLGSLPLEGEAARRAGKTGFPTSSGPG